MALEDDEGEGKGLEVGDNSEASRGDYFKWNLVRRFVTNISINFQSMKNMMASDWMPVMEMWQGTWAKLVSVLS